MKKLYSRNAPFDNFKQQINITPNEEWLTNYNNFANEIKTIDDYEAYIKKRIGQIWHPHLLDKLYADNDSILVLGAGDAYQALSFIKKHPEKNIILSDIVTLALEKLSSFYGFRVKRIDARNIEFPEESFDLVYAQGIEYIFNDRDYKKMISQMCRVVKRGHIFAVITNSLEPPSPNRAKKLVINILSAVPLVWVLLHKLVKKENIKWTGYMRNLEDHLRIFFCLREFLLERIDFSYNKEGLLVSMAFLLRRKE